MTLGGKSGSPRGVCSASACDHGALSSVTSCPWSSSSAASLPPITSAARTTRKSAVDGRLLGEARAVLAADHPAALVEPSIASTELCSCFAAPAGLGDLGCSDRWRAPELVAGFSPSGAPRLLPSEWASWTRGRAARSPSSHRRPWPRPPPWPNCSLRRGSRAPLTTVSPRPAAGRSARRGSWAVAPQIRWRQPRR